MMSDETVLKRPFWLGLFYVDRRGEQVEGFGSNKKYARQEVWLSRGFREDGQPGLIYRNRDTLRFPMIGDRITLVAMGIFLGPDLGSRPIISGQMGETYSCNVADSIEFAPGSVSVEENTISLYYDADTGGIVNTWTPPKVTDGRKVRTHGKTANQSRAAQVAARIIRTVGRR